MSWASEAGNPGIEIGLIGINGPRVEPVLVNTIGQPAEDEEVTPMLFPARRGPTPEERQAVWKRIGQILDKAAVNARHVSDEEFESAIEEALAQR